MRVLVTGGAGFIGTHLVRRALAEGHAVRVLDNFSTGHRANLSEILDQIELVEGDLNDPAALGRAVAGVELIWHQAALPSVPRSVRDPLASHQANATGTLALLTAARAAGVRRVIYASSSSAYGDTPVLPKSEDLPPRPRSPYAVAKLAGEQYCQVFARLYDLETVALRYFNVFGPRQDPDSPYAAVIPRFIRALRAGEPPLIYGDGRQSRDFTYIANVVDANYLAARAPAAVASGQVYNVAGGAQTTLLELVALLNRLCGTDLAPRHEAPRPGDVAHSLAAIERARADLGYCPRIGVEEGLRRTLATGLRPPRGSPA